MKRQQQRNQRKLKRAQKGSSSLQSFNANKANKISEPSAQIQNDSCSFDKLLNERKIIKQFQMKRKLLMKALKQKQKQKNPRLITIRSYQIKEGVIKKQNVNQRNKANQIGSKNQIMLSKSNSAQLSYPKKLNSNQKKFMEHQISAGVQTPIYMSKTRKINKQKNNEIYNIRKHQTNRQKKFRIISPKIVNIFRLEKQIITKKQSNPKKDIEKIKQQVAHHFNKKQQEFSNFSDTNSLEKYSFSSQSESLNQPQYLRILSIMSGLNRDIEKYYEQKPLKDVILNQLRLKMNQKYIKHSNKHKLLKYQSKRNKKSFDQQIQKLKQPKLLKEIKQSSLFQHIQHQFKNQHNKLNSQKGFEALPKNQHVLKRQTRRSINDRFKLALVEDQHFEQNKSNPKLQLSQQSLKNLIKKKQKNRQSQTEEQEQDPSFDSMRAWRMQFREISKILLKKIVFLKAYVLQDKRIDYQIIQKRVRMEAKQQIDKLSQKRKEIYKRHVSHSYIRKTINQRAFLFPLNINKPKGIKLNVVKRLKQIKIGKKEIDQFGKSFQFNQFPKSNYQGNFTFEQFHSCNQSNHSSNLQKQNPQQLVFGTIQNNSNQLKIDV